MEKELFKKVLGYEDEKKELLLIRSWLLDDKLANNEKITLPTGLLFYGEPGCGKTLFLREYSESFNCPIYVVEGKEENVCSEINNIFQKARNDKMAVVLIDEIDLLISKDPKVERTLQQELDGINQKGRLIVMATTNHREFLDEALCRTGRFDREIHITYPGRKTRELIFKSFIDNLNVKNKDINFSHIARITTRCNGADIKAICNDAYLRCKEKITTEDLEKSYERVIHDDYSCSESDKLKKDYKVAVHEIGHMMMCLRYKEYFSFYRARITETGGCVETFDVDDNIDCTEKRIASVKIALSGYIAEKLIFGKPNIGSYEDLEKAHDLVERMTTHSCIDGADSFVQHYGSNENYFASEKRRYHNEKKVDKAIKKYMNDVSNYLKNNINLISTYAKELLENTKLYYKQVCINEMNNK